MDIRFSTMGVLKSVKDNVARRRGPMEPTEPGTSTLLEEVVLPGIEGRDCCCVGISMVGVVVKWC